jgi:hypothetical protein
VAEFFFVGGSTMKRIWKFILILIASGLILLIAGLFSIAKHGLPYQDPTPEMSARYKHSADIARVLCMVGGGVFLFGSVIGIICLIIPRFRPPLIK